MRKVWLIGINVFRQLMRNRILSVLFMFAVALAGVSLFLADLGQEAEDRLSRDFGLLAMEWIGFFTVLLAHLVLLFEETELKTISILLVKPIRRWQYLMGKVVGSILLLGLNQLGVLAVVGLLGWYKGIFIIDFQFLAATAYYFVELSFFSTVILLLSIFSSTVPACAAYSFFAFSLGHFTTYLVEWVDRLGRAQLAWLVKGIYYLTPNLSIFNLKDAMAEAHTELTRGFFLWPLGYALLYGGAVLAISVWQYEKKEY
jgi:ABC-type transport system involved in multi-copper enzyme maturation permease subunit